MATLKLSRAKGRDIKIEYGTSAESGGYHVPWVRKGRKKMRFPSKRSLSASLAMDRAEREAQRYLQTKI